MEFGPKDAICNHPLIILALNSGGRVKGRKFSCSGLKIAPPASPSRTKAALGSPVSHYLLLNANFWEGLSLIHSFYLAVNTIATRKQPKKHNWVSLLVSI